MCSYPAPTQATLIQLASSQTPCPHLSGSGTQWPLGAGLSLLWRPDPAEEPLQTMFSQAAHRARRSRRNLCSHLVLRTLMPCIQVQGGLLFMRARYKINTDSREVKRLGTGIQASPVEQTCQETVSQGKMSSGQGCQTDRSTLKHGSLASVTVNA